MNLFLMFLKRRLQRIQKILPREDRMQAAQLFEICQTVSRQFTREREDERQASAKTALQEKQTYRNVL